MFKPHQEPSEWLPKVLPLISIRNKCDISLTQHAFCSLPIGNRPNKRNGRENHVYQTLCFAEVLRKIFMGIEGRCNDGQLTPVFAARDADGNILRKGSHEHCFILPLDENKDGYIDEVLLFSPMGFPLSLMSVLPKIQSKILWCLTTPTPIRLP